MKCISAKCGNHRGILRSGRAAVLAAFLPGLFVPGWTPTAQAQSTKSTTNTPAVNPGQGNGHPLAWLRIIAFTDAPVVGADVRVSIKGSEELADIHGTTNNQGVVPIAVRSHGLLHRGQLCRVTVSGGTTNGNAFLWHLSADVEIADPAHQIVVVNPVTTLVSLVLDKESNLMRLPDLEPDDAEALVRRFLKLPSNYSLGMALRQGPHYVSPFFSAVTFMREARDAGGLDAFLQRLLQGLDLDPATHSFRDSTTHSVPQPQLLVAMDSSTQSNASTIVQTGMEAAVLDYGSSLGLYNMTGWAMSLAGLTASGSTSEDITVLENQLADLQSSIDNLSTQVSQLTQLVKSTATQTQYTEITTTAQQYATDIEGHENDLAFYSQYCPPLAAGSTPTTNVDPYCTANYPVVINELQTEYEGKYYEQVQNYVQDHGTLGTSGIPHLYSLWLGESKPFFRPADSTKMQNLYDYWDSILTSAANLRMEYFHYLNYQDPNSQGGNAALTNFMGDPTKNPPTTGVFQTYETANLKLMFPAVPVGTVIFTTDHTMWATDYPVSTFDACSVLWGSPPTYSITDYNVLSPISWNGIAGWVSPSLADFQSLVTGWSGSDPNSWLTAQTEAVAPDSPLSPGFANFVADTWSWCPTTVWTSTPTTSWMGYPTYILFYLNTGTAFTQWTGRSGYPYDANLLFLKRSLGQDEQYYWYQ